MTKNRIYSILLLLLLAGMPLYAARQKKAKPLHKHYIDLHAAAGYTSLLHPAEGASIPGGAGFLIGAGYEYNFKNWIVNAGLEFQFHNSTTRMPEMNTAVQYYYTPLADHIMTYGYDATDIRSTRNTGMLTIPLSVGYRFANCYYALIGANIGMGVFGSNRTRANVHINVTDPELPDPLENVGHMTGNYRFDQTDRWQVGFHIAPVAEIGIYLDQWLVKEKQDRKRMPPSYRLGLFAEYGVLNVDKNQQIASAVHPLIAGVHFTALICMNKPPKERKTKTKPAVTQPEQPKQPTPEPEPQPVIEDTIRYGDIEIIKEQPLVLENLMFVFGTADIIPESTGTLDQLLSLMLDRHELRIHITGHTDNVGTRSYNKRLSLDRAKAVYDYLLSHGVKAQRMSWSGEGADRPVDTNDTEEGRQRNRRVEITVIR